MYRYQGVIQPGIAVSRTAHLPARAIRLPVLVQEWHATMYTRTCIHMLQAFSISLLGTLEPWILPPGELHLVGFFIAGERLINPFVT